MIYYKKIILGARNMKMQKSNMRTYIQGNISPKQQETVQAHMDYLKFDSMGNVENNAYISTSPGEQIGASVDILEPTSQLPMHSHSFMEIFRYTSDSRVEYLVGTHRYILQKGDIICIPPGTCHQVLRYEPEDTPCVRDLIGISPSFLEYAEWGTLPQEYYLLRATPEREDFFARLCELCVQESYNRDVHWRKMISGAAQMLLTMIVRSSDLSIKAEKDGIFESVLAYVDENLNQKITLTETAQHFYTSERTVTREFQKNLGISFYRYVTQRRMLMAGNFIRTGIPLEEVCQKVGYSDYPTFYRAFKKEYGISPRQMKNDR